MPQLEENDTIGANIFSPPFVFQSNIEVKTLVCVSEKNPKANFESRNRREILFHKLECFLLFVNGIELIFPKISITE